MKKYQLSETKHLFIEEFEGALRAKVGFDDERDNGIWHTISSAYFTGQIKCFVTAVDENTAVLEWLGQYIHSTTLKVSGDVIATKDFPWLRGGGKEV